MILSVLVALVLSYVYKRRNAMEYGAVATFNSEAVAGTVRFQQSGDVLSVEIRAQMSSVTNTTHGFHIHTSGDMSNGCDSMGTHYDGGHNHKHGSRTAERREQRHLGDLGNVESDDHGLIHHDMMLSVRHHRLSINPHSKKSIVGRGVILHAAKDDLGVGDTLGSETTGNSGARIACGVVGLFR